MPIRLLKRICTVLIVLSIFCPTFTILAQGQAKEESWFGTLHDGTKINKEDLKRILGDLGKWIDTEGKEGQVTDLRGANLQKADLQGANLQKTMLWETNLQESDLDGADLQKAFLKGANLQKADLRGANLQEAMLWGANLQEAFLYKTNLQDAILWEANLGGAVFELKSNSLPDIPSIAQAIDLFHLRYEESPHALVELRKAFREAGLRKQEREITFAIKHSGFVNVISKGDLLTKIEVCLGWFFFELTCQWGIAPERPLFILAGLSVLFTFFYMIALNLENKKDGIWKHWIKERSRKDIGKDEPELLTYRGGRAICNGFYFSILSAFHFGWRDLNVGNWIARIQPHEYTLRASGWVRAVSGIQSLISVYLFVLSILTYFGRPFESY
jgi:hypothetical protein